MAYGRSLLHFPYASHFWDAWDYPSTTWDPLFDGLLDSDYFPPSTLSAYSLRPKAIAKKELKATKGNFSVMVNVNHFKLEEIEVTLKDNHVEVHGKHEERSDEHGFIQREFTRLYSVPDTIDSTKLKSTLRPDGILVIEAPKKVIEDPPSNEVKIPIAVLKPASEG